MPFMRAPTALLAHLERFANLKVAQIYTRSHAEFLGSHAHRRVHGFFRHIVRIADSTDGFQAAQSASGTVQYVTLEGGFWQSAVKTESPTIR